MEEQRQLLEIYRLHVEMADAVSRRRAAANGFYISLVSGLFALFALIVRLGDSPPPGWLLIAAGAFGVLICLVWTAHIRSYKQLNGGKFEILHRLEERLPFDFYKQEWDVLGRGKDAGKYRLLTKVESYVPWVFAAGYGVLFAFGAAAAIGD